MHALEAALGHTFADSQLLTDALTHPSSLGRLAKGKPAAYERLEFLGDRVLNLAVAAWLYAADPAASEGTLARRHAALVRRETLAAIGVRLHLLDHLQLAVGERENTRGHLTILGDAVEALLGALYLDGGFAPAEAFLRRELAEAVAAQASAAPEPKTALQEWAQGRGYPLPLYAVTAQSGPSHAPRFTVSVTIETKTGKQSAEATGTSKQEAEKAAAEKLLQTLQAIK